MNARHYAGRCTYRGDHTGQATRGGGGIVGRVMGPGTFGLIVVAETATYDPATNRTVVTFGAARRDEVRELAALGWRAS